MLERPPVFIATDEGATAVLRAARRRRWRQASAVAGVTVVLAGGSVGVAVQRAGHGGSDRLTVADGPAPAQSILPGPASAYPTPTARAVSPLPTAATGGGTVSGRGAHQGSVAGTTSGAGGAAVEPSSPPPSTHYSSAERVSPIWRTRGTIATTDLCSDGYGDIGSGWCIRFLGRFTAKRGHDVTVSASFCRMAEFDARTLKFKSTREIDMSIGRVDNSGNYKAAWHAGEGVHYSKPGGSVRMSGGECFIWHSTWDTRDAEGFVVPPGSYQVQFQLETDDYLYGGGDIQVTD